MTSNNALLAALAVAVLACGSFVPQAQAVPITGQVTMAGTATLNNMNLGSATAATSFSGVTVINPTTGSYAAPPTIGSSVNFNGFIFGGGGVTPLWSFSANGLLYRFNLVSSTIVSQSNSFLNISGIGSLTITGGTSNFDPTTGAWSFSIVNPGGGASSNFQFGFVSSNNAIPEGGSAFTLLGLSLIGIEFLRRKVLSA